MKITANISGLEAMKLGTPLRQALLEALRTRVASMPRRHDASDTPSAHEVGTLNAPPRRPR
jgi:hypothetical protein